MGSCTSTLPIADVVEPEKTESTTNQVGQGIPPPDCKALGVSCTHPALSPIIREYVRKHIRRDNGRKMCVHVYMADIRRELKAWIGADVYADYMVDFVWISKQFETAGWTVMSADSYEVVVCFADSSE